MRVLALRLFLPLLATSLLGMDSKMCIIALLSPYTQLKPRPIPNSPCQLGSGLS